MSNEPVGIIGLGLLGGALAARLGERGFNVIGCDPDAARSAAAEAVGVSIVADAAAVARSCRRVVLCLPDGNVVAQVLDSIAGVLQPEQIVIDTTTASPENMIEHARRLSSLGATFIEAEIAGSSAQARAGEALVFTAGNETDIVVCRDVLQCWAKQVHVVGPTGSAAKLKLVHNLVLGLHRAVLAEGLVFAEKLGLDASRVLEILKQSPAASTVMTTKGPKMTTRDYAPQATVRQHLKDVRLIVAAAATANAATPLSTVHASLLEKAVALGYSEADNSAVVEAYRTVSREK